MSDSSQRFAVSVHPGELHFNAGHFITFDGTCENLHGHNFHVRIEAEGDNNRDAFVIDFVQLTRIAAEICGQLHDKVLLPGNSSEVHLQQDGQQMHIASHGRKFSLPLENCEILPVDNTTAEMLAWYIMESLIPRLRSNSDLSHVDRLEVAVEEADQQWGICRRRLGKDT